jgi:hypothetical protein
MRFIDSIFRSSGSPIKISLIFALPVIAVLIVLLLTLDYLDEKSHHQHLIQQLKETARAYFTQVLVTRRWNAEHGGVYVEVTKKTQPNPYLADDPERDILTVDGKYFTKLNPSYMTREMSEFAEKMGIYKFSLTSLMLIDPKNAPDEWERKALGSFEAGELEAYDIVDVNGTEYFRYMAPLFVNKPCLKCHEKHGYELGDIRGGISVSIPADTQRSFHVALKSQNRKGLIIIGLFSSSMIIGIIWAFSRRLNRTIETELEAGKLKSAVQLAGATAHELRQPMTIIFGCSEILKDKIQQGEDVRQETEIIIDQCKRMDDIIVRMLNITQYRVKYYDEETDIFDLQSEEPNPDDEKTDNGVTS